MKEPDGRVSLQVSEGRKLPGCIFIPELSEGVNEPFNDLSLFSADSLIDGESLRVTYENDSTGFSRVHQRLIRTNGAYGWSEEGEVLLNTESKDGQILAALLHGILNPNKPPLMPVRIKGSQWTSCRNRLFENEPSGDYLVFFAVSHKNVIDVINRADDDLPYGVATGRNRYKLEILTYSTQHVISSNERLFLNQG